MAKPKKNRRHAVGTRQTTVTLPLPLYQKVIEEAKLRNLTFNRYVTSIIEGRPLAAVDLQPLVIEIARLRRAIEEKPDGVLKEEVNQTCRYLERFLAEQIRRMK